MYVHNNKYNHNITSNIINNCVIIYNQLGAVDIINTIYDNNYGRIIYSYYGKIFIKDTKFINHYNYNTKSNGGINNCI